MGLGAEEAIPSDTLVGALFSITLDTIVPRFHETARSNFLSIVRGGLSTEYLFLSCYAGYTASEYLLGAGPTSLTVAYDRMGEAHNYDLYRLEHDAGQFSDEALMSEGEYEDYLDDMVTQVETSLSEIIGGRESVVFLAPMGAHNAIAIEVWQAVEQWGLQTDDSDVVHAVRYEVPEWDPEQTQTLANLKSRITTAVASDDFADDRIANASGLTQYYRDIGAYGDITPDDGSTATFTPAQPPPVPTCANGTAVTSPGTNRGLAHDCEALLEAKDTLPWHSFIRLGQDLGHHRLGRNHHGRHTKPRDQAGTALREPERHYPIVLGQAVRAYPPEPEQQLVDGGHTEGARVAVQPGGAETVGELSHGLQTVALEEVATNDLSSLNLLYCRPPAPENLRASSTSDTGVTLNWDPVSNTSKYRLEYRGPDVGSWAVVSDTLTVTTHTMSDLACGTPYQYRVSAYGSGTTYAAEWSKTSEALGAPTAECVTPVFDVRARAVVGATVATVSATDPNGDTVTYNITAGNGAGKFAIGRSTGGSRWMEGWKGPSLPMP